MIDEKLLALLACPACQGDVQLKDGKIVCTRCRRVYPIVDGIPVLLVDSAQQ
ncbi:MAG: Trm112 family protein [Candidatus Omnitrophica bacterium]|nr:Trm112 family protein [Candidatus Omnitrophota bacterium]MDE2009990.1 Trm112 family protein [Candidatus Omnitrophota bacterium]MDE2215325.1 Trm112 family protein [Candidatus Omnitrophota bacterium]MDE2231723.1 Trm112 family protein [Candidatus Omnitrophota bacterium]